MRSSPLLRRTAIGIGTVAIMFMCTGQAAGVTINIDHSTTYQTIAGFGGSVGGTPSQHQSTLMNDGAVSVIRVDYCEVTSSNFGASKGCYDAAEEKPLVVGSCWSPPANWKDNHSLNNGGHLLPQYYDDFADYTVQKLRDFKNLYGVEMYALSPQNEPAFQVFYASCIYDGADLIEVFKLIGQKIEAAGLKTKLFLPEDMYVAWGTSPYAPPLMLDTEAQSYVHAMAFHGYSADGVSPAEMSAGTLARMARQTSAKGWELWQTENAGSMGLGYARDVIGCLRYGKVSMYLKYGLYGDHPGMVGSLDEFYICQGQRTTTHYVAKTISKFIRRGSVQLKSSSSDSAVFSSFVAFHDPYENALAVTMVTGDQAQSIQVDGTDLPAEFELWVTNSSTNCVSQGTQSSSSTFTIPANSVATLYGTGYFAPSAVKRSRISVQTPGQSAAIKGAYRIDGRRLDPADAHGQGYRGLIIKEMKHGAANRHLGGDLRVQ